jgi:hypothetical protein
MTLDTVAIDTPARAATLLIPVMQHHPEKRFLI